MPGQKLYVLTVRNRLKRWFFTASKAVGLFHLSRLLTRKGLRILCYHGFTMGDEGAFRPNYFIAPATFEHRMRFLAENKFPVLHWERAMDCLERGRLPSCATVITIDDGMYSVYREALPILTRFEFSSLLYLASYYFVKKTPIFMLVVSYMFWKTKKTKVSLSDIGVPALDGGGERVLTERERDRLCDIVTEYGQNRCDNKGRTAICSALGERLGVDYGEIVERRVWGLVSPAELKEMATSGMSIQLHTHRHNFPPDPLQARKEIDDNRAAAEPLLDTRLTHFCYPSGEWNVEHWAVLRAAGVETATTCEPGLVYADTPRLALNRILDSERVSQIEFEAEVYGYSELIRRARRLVRSATGRSQAAAPRTSAGQHESPASTRGVK